jgi:hypothetical protein
VNGRRRVGLLFDHDFNALAHQRINAGRYDFDRAGFDLFSFPSNAGLIGFDLGRFARRQADKARRRGWQAVLSHQEQFGALAAALVAEAAGLPGSPPEAILACQHKLHARRVLDAVAPEANLAYADLPCAYGDEIPAGLSYPAYVKPVKAAFSVLARQVDSREQLQAHTRFGRRELWVIRRLVEPFERIARERLPQAGTAHRMLLEEPLPVGLPQFNLDGWVHGGQVHLLGIVDAICYPGSQAFARWELPTRLPPVVVERALDVARRFLGAVGFGPGFFNMEFFFDPATRAIKVIEFNPRLASQFGSLYRWVSGRDPHQMALDLAFGQDPLARPATAPTSGVATSLVWRAFAADRLPPMPGAEQQARFAAELPGAELHLFPKTRHGIERDLKWLGSHHYAIVNAGAADAQAMRALSARASRLLGWPDAPYQAAGAGLVHDAAPLTPRPLIGDLP